MNNISNTEHGTASDGDYKVSGRVFNANQEPVPGQEVLVVDVDLRGAAVYKTVRTVTELKKGGFELLGNSTTNEEGYYEVVFLSSSFRQLEIDLADVVAFAIDKDTISARSRLATRRDYVNKREIRNWDITLTDSIKRGPSEYARLIKVIEPFVNSNKLMLFQLFDSPDQVDFLSTETQQDRIRCSFAVQADYLCHTEPKSKLSREMVYGVGRQKIALSWASILMRTENELMTAIQNSIDANIIGPQIEKAIRLFVTNFLTLAREHAVTTPELQDLYKTIGFSIEDAALRNVVAQTYASFSGQPEEFWELLNAKGIPQKNIEALQLTNQLSLLTSQHTPLIEALQVKRKIKSPVELLKLNRKDWMGLLKSTGIPPDVGGSTEEESVQIYLNSILNTLNSSFPTQRVALMITSGELQIENSKVKERVERFLTGESDFDISVSRITAFSKEIGEISGKELFDPVVANLQQLQRIYQISPTPETMSNLLARGFTSAHQVAQISERTFIEQEAKALGGPAVALAVYNMARHQLMRAQHALLKLRDTLDTSMPSRIISPKQRQSISDFINTKV